MNQSALLDALRAAMEAPATDGYMTASEIAAAIGTDTVYGIRKLREHLNFMWRAGKIESTMVVRDFVSRRTKVPGYRIKG